MYFYSQFVKNLFERAFRILLQMEQSVHLHLVMLHLSALEHLLAHLYGFLHYCIYLIFHWWIRLYIFLTVQPDTSPFLYCTVLSLFHLPTILFDS